MILALKAVAGRIRGGAGRHTLAYALSVVLAATAVGVGGGFALAGHATADNTSKAAGASPTPSAAAHAPKKAKPRAKGNATATALVALVAKQTKTSNAQVVAALKNGQTLNQIAGAQAGAVAQAAVAKAKSKLDPMVASGKLTQAKETSTLTALQTKITTLMAEPGPQLAASLPSRATGAGHGKSPAASPSPSPTG